MKINFESLACESARTASDERTYSPSMMMFVSWFGEMTGLCGPSPMKIIRLRNSLPKPSVWPTSSQQVQFCPTTSIVRDQIHSPSSTGVTDVKYFPLAMIGHSTYGFVTSYNTQSALCGGNVVEPLITSVLFIQMPSSVGLVNLGLLSADAEAV